MVRRRIACRLRRCVHNSHKGYKREPTLSYIPCHVQCYRLCCFPHSRQDTQHGSMKQSKPHSKDFTQTYSHTHTWEQAQLGFSFLSESKKNSTTRSGVGVTWTVLIITRKMLHTCKHSALYQASLNMEFDQSLHSFVSYKSLTSLSPHALQTDKQNLTNLLFSSFTPK